MGLVEEVEVGFVCLGSVVLSFLHSDAADGFFFLFFGFCYWCLRRCYEE